jgi:hypothetical protein
MNMQLTEKESTVFNLLKKKQNAIIGDYIKQYKDNIEESGSPRTDTPPDRISRSVNLGTEEISQEGIRPEFLEKPSPENVIKSPYPSWDTQQATISSASSYYSPLEKLAREHLEKIEGGPPDPEKSFRQYEALIAWGLREYYKLPIPQEVKDAATDPRESEGLGDSINALIGTEHMVGDVADELLPKSRGGPLEILPDHIFGIPTAEVPRKLFVELADLTGLMANPKMILVINPIFKLGLGILKYTGTKAVNWVRSILRKAKIKPDESGGAVANRVTNIVSEETGIPVEKINKSREIALKELGVKLKDPGGGLRNKLEAELKEKIIKKLDSFSIKGGVKPSGIEALEGGSQGELFKNIIPEEGRGTGKAFKPVLEKEPAPTFYSKLAKEVKSPNFPNKVSGVAAGNRLRKVVKPEEMRWSGIEDFLKDKKSVTKQEIQDYLKLNEIKIEERVLGKRTDIDNADLQKTNDILNNEILGNGRLGFDSVGQARHAIINHADWIERWDIAPDSLLAQVGEKYRTIIGQNKPTKFHDQQLPGGENYKEVLLRLPGSETSPRFTSSHFPESDIHSHVRQNDRISSSGESVLFIEEIQSDWAQAGKRRGFVDEIELKELRASEKRYLEAAKPFTDEGKDAPQYLIDLATNTKERIREVEKGIPNAPLLKNWWELTLRNRLRAAVDGGYDRLAWISGKQTADRYDLSKAADKIRFTKNPDGSVSLEIQTKAGALENATAKNHAELESLVGKGVADKVVKQWDKKTFKGNFEQLEKRSAEITKKRDKFDFQDRKNREPLSLEKALIDNEIRAIKEGKVTTSIEGDNLRVGGQWAFNLYDKTIPWYLNKFGKKFGAKVENVKISSLVTPQTASDFRIVPVKVDRFEVFETSTGLNERLGAFTSMDAAKQAVGRMIADSKLGETAQYQSIPITPAMKRSATEEGFELFSGFDPTRMLKETPLDPNSVGVKVKDLVKERVFNIDKMFLKSEDFIRNFDTKLSPLERDALPFIREGMTHSARTTPSSAKRVLKKIGREDLFDIIKNPSPNLLKFNEKLGEYYDDAHKFLRENFDDVGFVKHYVTHIWKIPKDRKSEVLNYFTTHNPFTKKRTIPSLEAGIKLGLKPKTTDISELLRTYDQFKIKTAFNMKFAESLKNMVDSETGLKVMMRVDKAPADWVTIDHPSLSRAMAIGSLGEKGVILKKVPVKVHPEIAGEVKAVFANRLNHPVVNLLEIPNAFMKKGQLSLSFFHPFALVEAAFSNAIGTKAMSLFNPYKVYRALKNKDYEIYKRMPMANDSIDHGVSYSPLQDYQIARVRNALVNAERATKNIPVIGRGAKAVRTANDLWDRALWDYMHNTFKLWGYETQVMAALKQGNKITQRQYGRPMNRAEIEEAKNLVGAFINDSFGGQRWELQRLFKDPKVTQIMQWYILSPDWTLSTLKQAFAPIKGHLLMQGGASLERQLAGKLLRKRGLMFWLRAGLYFNLIAQSANIVNSEIWLDEPRFTWQNDPGHKLNIFAGFNEDGTKRYLRMGKQFREVMEWAIEPDKRFGAKLGPGVREIMRQATKSDPGSGFPSEFAELEFYESIPQRLKSIAMTGIPFSMRHLVTGSPKNFMFTLPASKGMTNYKTVDLFKKAIRNVDINRVAEVYFAALENNLDAESLFKSAKSSVKADITMDNKKFAKRILGELTVLDNPQAQKDLYNHYKERGIISPAIEKIFEDMAKKKSSIDRQKEAAGIQ